MQFTIIFIACFTMLILDFIWLSISHKMYKDMVLSIQRYPSFEINKIYAIGAYIVMCAVVAFVMVPNIYNSSSIFRNGSMIGFAIYSIFNLTNLAIFKDYSVKVAIIDTIWGTILFSIIAAIIVALSKYNL